eukprot:1398856-Prymnesium_polylepis.1
MGHQCIETCSCCGGGCRWGMVWIPAKKNLHPISPIELRARTYRHIMPHLTYYAPPAMESSRFGTVTRYSQGSSLRNRLTEIRLAVLSSISHTRRDFRNQGGRATGARKMLDGVFCALISKKSRAGRG